MAVKIKLTPEQEKKLQGCMSKPQGKYSVLLNRCDSPIQKCLKEVGIDTNNQILLVSLGNKLLDKGVVNGVKEYPGTRPATGSSAPWAK
jgi:hypothetical protein